MKKNQAERLGYAMRKANSLLPSAVELAERMRLIFTPTKQAMDELKRLGIVKYNG